MKLLPVMIAIPLGMGFLLPLISSKRARVADVLAGLASLSLLAVALALTGARGVYEVGGWAAPVGIVLVLDGLSWLMLVTVAVVSFAATLFSARYMDHYTARPRYYALFMLMVAGMNAAVLTGDVFNLYVYIEVAAVASYALVAFGCRQAELEASFKYAVLGSIASAFILLGVGVLYCLFGTLNMAHLSEKMAAVGATRGAVFSLTFLIAGLGLKAALVPFHAWLPDAHPSAPAPISAMLSGVLIKAIGVYALLRILFSVYGITADIATALMWLGTLSMVVGVFLAIMQWDFKRLLAYHSVSQIGYVMLGIGAGGAVLAAGGSPAVAALGFVGGLFHLVNHAVFKSLLFLTAGAVEYATGTRELKEMGGLRERMPVTAGTSLVASMSIAGVPPFNGFFSKLLIIFACASAGYYGFATWAVIVSIMTLASFMKVQKYAFFGKLRERWRSLTEVPLTMRLAMLLLAVLCLGTSALMIPSVRQGVLDPARYSLIDRQQYVDSVLGPAREARHEQPDLKIAEK
ncbi:MAG: proton-conducting transporter membrane subunit [Candidatus Brocadiia bacterium]